MGSGFARRGARFPERGPIKQNRGYLSEHKNTTRPCPTGRLSSPTAGVGGGSQNRGLLELYNIILSKNSSIP